MVARNSLTSRPERKKKAGKKPKKVKYPAIRDLPGSVAEPDLPFTMKNIPVPGKSPLNEQVIRHFVDLIKKGLSTDAILDYLGLHPVVFQRWMTRGKNWIEANGKPKEDAAYALFYVNFRRAHAEYRMQLTNNLHGPSSGAEGRWVRWIAILERRDRDTWGRQPPAGGSTDEYEADEVFL